MNEMLTLCLMSTLSFIEADCDFEEMGCENVKRYGYFGSGHSKWLRKIQRPHLICLSKMPRPEASQRSFSVIMWCDHRLPQIWEAPNLASFVIPSQMSSALATPHISVTREMSGLRQQSPLFFTIFIV